MGQKSHSSNPASVHHWRDVSHNPNDRRVRTYLRDYLRERYQGRIPSTHDFLKDFVRDCTALDIGVVAHEIERTKSPLWKHNMVRSTATHAVGVDIIEDAVAALVERGFDIRCVDATSDVDLGERFERVVIGDVIEHVNNPVKLLQFAKRHLTPDGRILCTTPNPFFIATLVSSVREGVFIPNAEHVAWISPTMAIEIAHRAGLELDAYWHTQGDGKTFKRKLAVKMLELGNLRESELFSGSFYYVFKLSSDSERD
ncbi:MAG: methyltransferase domain-containing protein [Myxococcota bacterium]|jgi:SAM-dependent methyltransferase|nr:methyltransferase domain-containing protein [Myxococcota bacterium]